MHRAKIGLVIGALLLACMAGIARAQDEPLTLAVFDFEAKEAKGGNVNADTGQKIADLLTVFLSAKENLQLVERAQLKKILEELALNRTGVVDPAQAVKVGSLVGAKILVTGRVSVINDKLYLTGKAMSVETSLVTAQMAKGALNADLDTIVQELADKLADYLAKNRGKMVVKIATPADQVTALQEALKDKNLPTVSVTIPEHLVGAQAVDPAAQTEFMYLMRKVGIAVIDSSKLGLADWADEFFKDSGTRLPDKASQVDIVFVGEGFAEFAGRTQDLITENARLEVKAVDVKTNKILGISRQTTKHVDLSEQIAGKTALQKAAGEAAVEMLPEVVDEWNKLHAKDKKD